MTKVKNVVGLARGIFLMEIKIKAVFYFIPEFMRRRMSWKRYFAFLKRLLYFLSKMQHSKFVKIGKATRIDLYVPGYPSAAFYKACKKFMVFDEKLPCSTVLISVTSACRYNCQHCYQKYDKGRDVDIHLLLKTIRELQNMGIAFFNIEGGEPFLVYDRLKQVCSAFDKRSELWVNSTGDGITIERLQELKTLNLIAIMFSLPSPVPDEFNNFMGKNSAWETMENAVELCHQTSIAVAFNSCLKKEDYYNGTFERIMEKAKKFKAAVIQFIKPKPAGGWLETGVVEFTGQEIEYIKNLVTIYNHDKKFRDYPAISAQIIEEDKNVFGCTAGGTDRFYINAKGDVQPCEFLNISFGNIAQEDFKIIYERMRAQFLEPGECWLCENFSGKILRSFRQNKLSSLPLPPELSKPIYENWNRGSRTELYRRLKEIE